MIMRRNRIADVGRAWSFGGLAIRNALTLGLHVRSEADDTSDAQKEHRVRLWWSLYCLECSLDELTGRPTCISDRDTSTPFPLNANEVDVSTGKIFYEKQKRISPSTVSSRRASLSTPLRLLALSHDTNKIH
jgi:hypothetical protein